MIIMSYVGLAIVSVIYNNVRELVHSDKSCKHANSLDRLSKPFYLEIKLKVSVSEMSIIHHCTTTESVVSQS